MPSVNVLFVSAPPIIEFSGFCCAFFSPARTSWTSVEGMRVLLVRVRYGRA